MIETEVQKASVLSYIFTITPFSLVRDQAGVPCLVLTSLNTSDASFVHRSTCRVQMDSHCGWDESEIDRVQRCIDRKEYPSDFSLMNRRS
jgi:hypothetical protein